LGELKEMLRCGKVLITCIILAVYFGFLMGIALAGTETGEFCPTCPDWTDLEGWFAKKDAYEKAQMNSGGKQSSTNINTGTEVPVKAADAAEKPAPAYPKAALITSAASSFDGFVILDVREPEDYQRGHIPGARSLYWGDLQIGDALDPALAESILRKTGINNSDSIIIYGGEDEGADYAFWALSYLGHRNLSKLDGGVDAAWSRGIVPDGSIPVVVESNYTVHLVPGLMVNESTLPEWLDRTDLHILDARDWIEYGKSKLTIDSYPLDEKLLFDEDAKIHDASTLEDLFNRRGLDRDEIQLVYGTPQAYSLFYGLELMGYNATLLEGDWWQKTEWAVSEVR
jgi:thiosulfate/3-mercaptopyruvate sulfurtransferase